MDPSPPASAPAASTPAAAETPKSTGAESLQAPPGYKFVKVRKADGSVATVKRKLSPGEEGSTPAPQGAAPSTTGDSSPPTETPTAAPKFKIVTVRKADGSLVKVRRPITNESEATDNEHASPSQGASSAAQTSSAAADTKSTGDKPITTGVASTRSVSKPDQPTTTTTTATEPAKETTVKTSSVATTDGPKAIEGASDARDVGQVHADALAEQALHNRERRTHRLKSSLLRGFGMAVGAAIPSLEIAHDFEDGDEILSDDDDWSVDDGDDNDGHGDDEHDITDELHERDISDTSTAHEETSTGSGTHVTFDAGAALGGLAATAVATAASQPPPPPPAAKAAARAAQNGTTEKSNPEKEKHTYKISAKELADIEQATTEKVTEKKLNRHWANLTFYFMASLSIVLPSLFLLLAGFIGAMKHKPVASNWSKMEDGIKFAVSAWPIVFAAVVAQCFKAWATFKVERGIKLMELEQLVGSSSFASAVKQPLLLRRIDLLTLALFAVWCLSPIGSQALQRVYSMDRRVVNDTADVWMVPSYGPNRMFSPSNVTAKVDNPEYDRLLQLVETHYIAAFAPSPPTDRYFSDSYLHPKLKDPVSGATLQAYGNYLTYPTTGLFTSEQDASSLSTPSAQKAESTIPRFEYLEFLMPYSYFAFTCDDPWQTKTQAELDALEDFPFAFSDSGTFGVALTAANSTSSDYTGIRIASANGATIAANATAAANETLKFPWENPDYPFSYIECRFEQVFYETRISCTTDLTTILPDCTASTSPQDTKAILPERTKSMKTPLDDFSYQFAYANPSVLGSSASTSTEFYLLTGGGLTGDPNPNEAKILSDVDPSYFKESLAFLFNTFVGLGYCPKCVNMYTNSAYDVDPEIKAIAQRITANHLLAKDLIFTVNPGWLACFIICASILFLAGLAGVIVESMTVAPDILGYVSTVARNSRYLQLPKTSSAMSGGERAKTVGAVKVMIQDVKGSADVGKIALGMKHEKAQRLVPGRLYR